MKKMKEKLFENVNGKLKRAACILAIGGILLVAILGTLATYTTWKYFQGMGANSTVYVLTTMITYVAAGWTLYSFADLAENTKTIRDVFCDEEEYEWVGEEDEETCSCGCGCENTESDSTEEDK